MHDDSFRSLIQSFITDIESITNTLSPESVSALARPCAFLRIGMIRAEVCEPPREDSVWKCENFMMFDCGNADASNELTISKSTKTGTDFIYHICGISGEQPWSDEEKNDIGILIDLLFANNEKSRLMMSNYRLTFFDQDMQVSNIKYYFKSMAELIRKGLINQYTAMYFNLRKFSGINMRLGQKQGSKVMRKFIHHIADIAGEGNTVSRFGGDNFAILCKHEYTDTVLDALMGTAVTYNEETGDRIIVSAYVGIYVVTDDMPVHSTDDVIEGAAIALAIAKRYSKDNHAFFNAEMQEKHNHQLLIHSQFPSALENEEFVVYYQPKVSTETYRIVGAEALCRWKHNGRIIPPNEFIPVLERGMDICKLDLYMLDHVCRDIRRWLDEGRDAVKVSVNLSRRHLSDSDLLKHIVEIIDRNELPHEYIEIELTETTSEVEFQNLRRVIDGLQEEGITTSVDDFGVGYSFLTLIKDLPWDTLKIDKSLIPEAEQSDQKKEALLKYVIGMSKEIGLECIAEGVETKEQEALLKTTSCNIIQGFYFDKPLPINEFETRLDNYDYQK